jgi:hypothetical protein
MKKAMCPLFPTLGSPMTQDRAEELFGPRHLGGDRQNPFREGVDRNRQEMLKNIAATCPVPRGIYSRKCTPQAVCA